MSKVTLNDIASGFNLSKINDNFDKIEDALNNKVLYRDNPVGEDNTVKQDIDMNGHKLYNLAAPAGDSHAARLKDVKNAVEGLSGQTANLIAFEPTANIPENNIQGAIERVAKSTGVANVNDFYLAAEADHTGMFNRATAHSRKVYVPAGTYYLDSAQWPSDTEIYGDGFNSLLYVRASSRCAFLINSPSPAVSTNVQNLYMHDLQIRGEVDVSGVGFAEHNHLLNLNGVTNVTLERCLFKGFRGDGVYFGSHSDGGLERHNEHIVVRNCVFDGVNRDNRNGLTFIDVDGCLVEGNYFTNCSRANMPGPIDFEPDVFSFHVIRNVVVRNNTFTSNGGNVAEVSFYIPSVVAYDPRNIVVQGNTSENYLGTGQFFYFSSSRVSTSTSTVNDIRVTDNHIKNGNRAFQIGNGRRVLVENNTFADMKDGGIVGLGAGNVTDLVVDNTRFERNGYSGGNGFTICNVNGLHITNSKFIDCGAGTPGSANAIDFNAGTSSNVFLENNEFTSPTGKTQIAIQKEAGHTFNSTSNRALNNQLNGLGSAFVSSISNSGDVGATAWNPSVFGTETGGSCTYSAQKGVYQRIFGRVGFSFNIAWSGHTGTGQPYIPLPLEVNATLEPSFFPVMVAGSGISGLPAGAKVVALINGGASRIQLYTENAGVLSALTLTATGTLYIAGEFTS